MYSMHVCDFRTVSCVLHNEKNWLIHEIFSVEIIICSFENIGIWNIELLSNAIRKWWLTIEKVKFEKVEFLNIDLWGLNIWREKNNSNFSNFKNINCSIIFCNIFVVVRDIMNRLGMCAWKWMIYQFPWNFHLTNALIIKFCSSYYCCHRSMLLLSIQYNNNYQYHSYIIFWKCNKYLLWQKRKKGQWQESTIIHVQKRKYF